MYYLIIKLHNLCLFFSLFWFNYFWPKTAEPHTSVGKDLNFLFVAGKTTHPPNEIIFFPLLRRQPQNFLPQNPKLVNGVTWAQGWQVKRELPTSLSCSPGSQLQEGQAWQDPQLPPKAPPLSSHNCFDKPLSFSLNNQRSTLKSKCPSAIKLLFTLRCKLFKMDLQPEQ